MTHAKNTEESYRSRSSERPATTPTRPDVPHSTLSRSETTIDRTDTQKGLTPVEQAALELSMQRHRKALDLLARH
jgi:hypothetical protein